MFVFSHLGAISPEAAAVRKTLPACYSKEFNDCVTALIAAERTGVTPVLTPYCSIYAPGFLSTSKVVWNEAVDSMPYCPEPPRPKKKSAVLPIAIGVGVVGALALAVNATGSRF